MNSLRLSPNNVSHLKEHAVNPFSFQIGVATKRKIQYCDRLIKFYEGQHTVSGEYKMLTARDEWAQRRGWVLAKKL